MAATTQPRKRPTPKQRWGAEAQENHVHRWQWESVSPTHPKHPLQVEARQVRRLDRPSTRWMSAAYAAKYTGIPERFITDSYPRRIISGRFSDLYEYAVTRTYREWARLADRNHQ